jgi:hypothetical protein
MSHREAEPGIPRRTRALRFLLPVLIVLLSGGLLWSFLPQSAAPPPDTHAEERPVQGAHDPTLVGRGDPAPGRPRDPAVERARNEADAVPPPEGHGPVTVTVLDVEGRPLQGALVELRPRGARFSSLQTDAEGRAAFPDLNLAKPCDLFVHTAPYLQIRNHRDPDWMPADVTIELERALRVTGTVVDENGEFAGDYRVTYSLVGSDETQDVLMDQPGRFEIGDLGPGRLKIWATHKEHNPRYLTTAAPLAAGPLEVDAGAQDIVLSVVRGGVLHVQVEDALVDERRGPLLAMARASDTGRSHTAEVDLDGHAVFLGLAPGAAYRLTILGLGRNQFVDVGDLRPQPKVQVVKSQTGARIEGRFLAPADVALDKAYVVATHDTLGTTRGRLDRQGASFVIDGLMPDTTWTVVLRGVSARGLENVHLEAQAEARTGTSVQLTLR